MKEGTALFEEKDSETVDEPAKKDCSKPRTQTDSN